MTAPVGKAEPLQFRVRATLDQLRRELLEQRNEQGHWTGALAASALSTATAVSALAAARQRGSGEDLADWIDRGIDYLRCQQNEDGGFGDTDRSHSNIATSYLVGAASALAVQTRGRGLEPSQVDRLRDYIARQGSLDGLRRRYGTDKTFVVPILTNLAIAGQVAWEDVPALPFEAAVVPQSMYRLMRMPVVSYAIPALVAIGQARHVQRPSRWPLRALREAAVPRSLQVLERMQPDSGGYLEATPLTSFVVMSLSATGRANHPVSQRGIAFLQQSMSADGSWPIDTNLATWVTSLSSHALRCDPLDDRAWCDERLVRWQLACQHRVRHPFTGAPPGGWGWTDLSGAVPDGDDTPAAILALVDRCREPFAAGTARGDVGRAIIEGVVWLLQLQNRDGGWPTFCRGWGKLPFDRSSTDLTAHAIRAIRSAARARLLESALERRCEQAVLRGEKFLVRQQRAGGAWLPLWFGNQDDPDETNPVYGTSRVLLSFDPDAASTPPAILQAYADGCEALLGLQNRDGGWGGGRSLARWWTARSGAGSSQRDPLGSPKFDAGDDPWSRSSMEETAIAVEALATVQLVCGRRPELVDKMCPAGRKGALEGAIIAGVEFLLTGVASGQHREPWPIGFYFAKLWYHERLYPWVFTMAALGKYLRSIDDHADSDWPR